MAAIHTCGFAHVNSLLGILADEMGLGKTLQSISILAYMRDFQKVKTTSNHARIQICNSACTTDGFVAGIAWRCKWCADLSNGGGSTLRLLLCFWTCAQQRSTVVGIRNSPCTPPSLASVLSRPCGCAVSAAKSFVRFLAFEFSVAPIHFLERLGLPGCTS